MSTVKTNEPTSDIQVGDSAPDFSAPDQRGQMIQLGNYRGKQNVVLYFYPKDFSPGCTQEACTFRDQYEAFKSAGAEVIGVSIDSAASHKTFAQTLRLPFVLVSDENGRLAQQYGVKKFMGVLGGRVTFVIDKAGVVRHRFVSNFNMTAHIDEALRVLQSLGDGG